MNKTTTPLAVPWEHLGSESGLGSSWTWTTPHFTVTIIAEGPEGNQMFNWKILDKSSGFPRPFDNGLEISFSDATQSVLETVGKAYARELGYQAYAGKLATTFQIADGTKYDFAPAIGENVIIEVLSEEMGEEIYTGIFDILNYDFTVTTGDDSLIIPPLKVIDVKKEVGMTSLIKQNNVKKVARSKNNRIVYEEWRKGCTGKPGYHPGTTMHDPGAPYCSMHNV